MEHGREQHSSEGAAYTPQVVFWDMRDAFLERLYRHRVTDARIAPLLSDLDGVRGWVSTTHALDLNPGTDVKAARASVSGGGLRISGLWRKQCSWAYQLRYRWHECNCSIAAYCAGNHTDRSRSSVRRQGT